MTIILIDGLN